MEGTLWAIVPAIFAIILALITKEVYISLFAGILLGAFFVGSGNPIEAFKVTTNVISQQLGGDHAYILLFVAILGILVVLITSSGATKAYGEWAGRKIKSSQGAILSTVGLGCLIFVDDYFNCLTVGNVMRPVTDRFKISREKLAYIVDCTAAPVCILIPISSWAATVVTYLGESANPFVAYLKSVPLNFYPILALLMVFAIAIFKADFGAMRRKEKEVQNITYTDEEISQTNQKSRVYDLFIPILFLIFVNIFFMLYTGGLLDGVSLWTAFGDCDAGLALAMGSFVSLIFAGIYYYCRKLLSFKEIMDSIVTGVKTMIPSIIVLILAWAIGNIVSGAEYLNLRNATIFTNMGTNAWYFPAIFFLMSMGISFSTGTSWGTFAMLLPIATACLNVDTLLYFLTVASVLSGAVCGDHSSPISDTSIMASTGANCKIIDHFKTQFPYVILVAVVSTVMYVILGLLALTSISYELLVVIGLGGGIALLLLSLFVLKRLSERKFA